MLVSITRLHVRRWYLLPFITMHTQGVIRQARSSPGFLSGQLAAEQLTGLWTITVWIDEKAMRGFRNSAAHLKAMPRLLDWCDEASYTHWEQDDSKPPTVQEAFERLRDNGKLSKVRYPSTRHGAGKTVAEGAPKPGLAIRPASG